MEIEINLERREETIDHILHILSVDEKVCKKFEDDGCMYIKYNHGRLYRRNNIFYHINYYLEFIYMFDENMDPMKLGDSWGDWCHNCQQHYEEESGSQEYYLISQIMDNDKPLCEIFHENNYSPRDI